MTLLPQLSMYVCGLPVREILNGRLFHICGPSHQNKGVVVRAVPLKTVLSKLWQSITCRSIAMNSLPSFLFDPSRTGTFATEPFASSAAGSSSNSTPSTVFKQHDGRSLRHRSRMTVAAKGISDVGSPGPTGLSPRSPAKAACRPCASPI